jgi:cation diffusion facilitator family transporter
MSLAAALLLAAAKLVVGLTTGSLGVLAEAVHSGLDAAAAVLTLYAVGIAERPPDAAHQYGHGKAQHLAALSEAVLLSAAALWIATEAVSRLRSGSHDVDPTWYAFALMGGVLVVDAGRTAVSLREGRRGRNAALIANAYHFASDFAGTVAVLIGLALVSAGVDGGDAWAALFVAVLVLVAAVRLGVGNVHVLMDRAPIGLAGEIERAALGVQGVREVRAVRVREAGGETFAEVTIGVSRLEGLERSHETMDRVEEAVRASVGPAQVAVHVEPTASRERPTERVAAAALRVPGVVETHNINVLEGPDGRAVTLHARLGANFTMAQVAPVLARLKDEIGREFGVARVYVHVEPFHPEAQPARDVSAARHATAPCRRRRPRRPGGRRGRHRRSGLAGRAQWAARVTVTFRVCPLWKTSSVTVSPGCFCEIVSASTEKSLISLPSILVITSPPSV